MVYRAARHLPLRRLVAAILRRDIDDGFIVGGADRVLVVGGAV